MGKEYVITDGERFLRKDINDKWKPTSCLAIADVFTRYDMARSVWQYDLPRKIKDKFYVGVITDDNKVEFVIDYDRENQNAEQPHAIEVSCGSDPNIQRWLDKLGEIDTIFDEVKEREPETLSHLAIVEAALKDIDHYIEWYKPPAYIRCKTYDLQQKLLDRRRELKNEYRICQIISSFENKHKGGMQAMVKSIKALQRQTYTPRVLSGLFEGNFNIADYDYLWKENNSAKDSAVS